MFVGFDVFVCSILKGLIGAWDGNSFTCNAILVIW